MKRYVWEDGSAWVRQLTRRAAGNDLTLARVTEVEVVSALVRHQPPLPSTDLIDALSEFQTDCRRRHFRFVNVTRVLTARAAQLVSAYRLRGYDAIQLAAALQTRDRLAARGLGAPTLISADDDLNRAAAAEGLSVDNPLRHP